MYDRNYLCWGSQQHVSLFSRISNGKLHVMPESFSRKPRRVTKTFHEQGNRSTVVFCITRAVQNRVKFLRFRISYVTRDRVINFRLKLFLRTVLTPRGPRDELNRFKDLWEPLFTFWVFFYYFFGFFFSGCFKEVN